MKLTALGVGDQASKDRFSLGLTKWVSEVESMKQAEVKAPIRVGL